jgi:hypothetical protein
MLMSRIVWSIELLSFHQNLNAFDYADETIAKLCTVYSANTVDILDLTHQETDLI